jgi:hypothetical protein
MKRQTTKMLAALATLCLTGPAFAESDLEARAEAPRLNLSLGTGVVFPQLQSELGTTLGVQLGVGYRVFGGLVPFVSAGYAQPSVETEQTDPRLPGDYMTDTVQKELTLSAGAFWRFLPADASFNGYAGLAARIWLLETRTNGMSGGNEFLQNEETSTRLGGAVFGGGELRLGPGAAMVELDIGGSDLPHLVTGDVATTAVTLLVGYRLLLM